MIPINNLKYAITVFIVFILICCSNGFAQTKDTSIVVDNRSKAIGYSCFLREDLIEHVKNGDTLAVNKLRNTTIAFKYDDEITVKSVLLTAREDQMLQFYNGEYDKLLKGIKGKYDYFLSSDRNKKGYRGPNFECGNLTLFMLDFWKKESVNIISDIKESELLTAEKDLLILYWNNILSYIEDERELSPEINEKAKGYLNQYPETEYQSFVSRLSTIKRTYKPRAMFVNFGLGKSYPTGPIDSYLQSDIVMDFDVGYNYNNWNISLGGSLHGFEYKDSSKISQIDTIQLSESSNLEYGGVNLKIGYSFFNESRIRLEPFVSIGLNRFVNNIHVPDSTNIRQNGKYHAVLGLGSEVGVKLMENIFNFETYSVYTEQEEREFLYTPLYLNFKFGYYPQVFDSPTNINGDIFYFSVGLECFFGSLKANYKY